MSGDALLRSRHHELTLKLIAQIKTAALDLRRAAERSRLVIAESREALKRASSGPSSSATTSPNQRV